MFGGQSTSFDGLKFSPQFLDWYPPFLGFWIVETFWNQQMSQAAIDQPQSTSSGLFSNHPLQKEGLWHWVYNNRNWMLRTFKTKTPIGDPEQQFSMVKPPFFQSKKHVTPNWNPWFLTFKISYIEIIFSDGFPRGVLDDIDCSIQKLSIRFKSLLHWWLHWRPPRPSAAFSVGSRARSVAPWSRAPQNWFHGMVAEAPMAGDPIIMGFNLQKLGALTYRLGLNQQKT